ncbi:MAG: hypothetical protein COA54_02500 [Thiotrichaceae bacterium]|nr:MAG: hypothetical protein COA54_02500 [Thiotrichaceae bacterium]
MALADYQSLIDNKVRDDASIIEVADRDQALLSAVIRYSNDKPDEEVEDVVVAGGQSINLPAGWQANFSSLKNIEFPIGNVPPRYLESGAYGIYNAPGGKTVMVRNSLTANDTVRMVFTVKHIVDAVNETPPDIHREAIACWAAALLCEQLASYYSGDSDSLIQADSVDHASKARDFAARARTFRKFYFDTLGIDPKKNVAAGVVVDLDMADSRGGNRLTHSRRFR